MKVGAFIQSTLNGEVFEVIDSHTGILLSDYSNTDDKLPRRTLPPHFRHLTSEEAAIAVTVVTWLRRELSRDPALRNLGLLLDYSCKDLPVTDEMREVTDLLTLNIPWVMPALLCVSDRQPWLLPAVKTCRPQYAHLFERK